MNEMLNTLLLLVFIWPLLLAIGLMSGLFRGLAVALAPWAALPGLLASLLLTPDIMLEIPWLLLGTHLGFDETARVFLFFSSLLWLVAGVYATGYFKNDLSKPTFFVGFLLAMTGNLGLILAQDMTIFYCFFTLMSFASYALVVHTSKPEALRAGRIYIILVVIGEVILFVGFVMAAQAAGSLEFETVRSSLTDAVLRDWIIGLVLLGFGIKAGVVGLHVWLPLAHPVAPTPASAVLSGAMIAAGLLGWLRMLPLGEIALPYWGEVLIIAGVVAIFYAVFVGLFQSNPKTVLAYSSISKMGLMTMAVGIGLIEPDSWPLILSAILIFALHHGLAKGALFLGVGMVASRVTSKAQGYLLSAGLLIPALALAGAPWTSGMIAKHLLKNQVTSEILPWGDWLQILLALGSVAASILMARFLYLVWRQYKSSTAEKTIPRVMWLSWCALLLVIVLNPWFIPLTNPQDHWTGEVIISSLWPVVLGGGLFIVWLVSKRFHGYFRFSIPSGDILLIVERWLWPVLVSGISCCVTALGKGRFLVLAVTQEWSSYLGRISFLHAVENRLRQWAIAVTLFLILTIVFIILVTQNI